MSFWFCCLLYYVFI